jgi:hypothetical protein
MTRARMSDYNYQYSGGDLECIIADRAVRGVCLGCGAPPDGEPQLLYGPTGHAPYCDIPGVFVIQHPPVEVLEERRRRVEGMEGT